MRAHKIMSGVLLSLSAFALITCSSTKEKSVDNTPIENVAISAKKAQYFPGDTLPADYVAQGGDVEAYFSIKAIPDSVFKLMEGNSFKNDSPVKRSDLRYLTCLHATADGYSVVGEMIVATSIAEKVQNILHKLYEAHYPIERMRLIDNYGADDEQSMTANNSSAFNFRYVSGTRTVSKHGRGLAVDINPLYNPCRKTLKSGKVVIEPAAGKAYVDRSAKFDYKIERGDLCYRLFKEAGFRWGGDWRTVKDYQHFEMP